MTLVCIERPNRSKKRTFTASDVGRIACQAIKSGESRKKIIDKINEKCPDMEVCDREFIKASIANALSLLLGVAVVFLIPAELLAGAVIAILAVAARILPFLARSAVIRRFVSLLEKLKDVKFDFDSAIKVLENIAK